MKNVYYLINQLTNCPNFANRNLELGKQTLSVFVPFTPLGGGHPGQTQSKTVNNARRRIRVSSAQT